MSETTTKVKTVYGTFHTWTNDLVTDHLKRYSAHTRNELSMLLTFVRPGDYVIDIGAHIGTFAIPLARKVGENGHVLAIEASHENFELLQRNIVTNGLESRVTPINAIVGDEKAHCTKIIPNQGNSGAYRFVPTNNDSEDLVSSINTDQLVRSVFGETGFRLMKIDIEGAEGKALHSCENLIRAHQPIIYTEVNQPALRSFNISVEDLGNHLMSCGYDLFRNIGERNSNNDNFKLQKLWKLVDGGGLFDVLAIHRTDERYPNQYGRFMSYIAWQSPIFLKKLVTKVLPNTMINIIKKISRS